MALGTAPTSYPSWAFNSTQLVSLVVANVAAWNALTGTGTWQTTPYSTASTAPYDTGFQVTDTRLQQILVESRIQSSMLAQALAILDDPQTQLRPDFVANDASVTS